MDAVLDHLAWVVIIYALGGVTGPMVFKLGMKCLKKVFKD